MSVMTDQKIVPCRLPTFRKFFCSKFAYSKIYKKFGGKHFYNMRALKIFDVSQKSGHHPSNLGGAGFFKISN